MIDDGAPQQKVFSISELTRNIKRTLEGRADFNNIWLKGEISNLTFHSSGHIYFTLKDSDAVISAVFFKHANKNLMFKMKEGMSILAFGSITVFEKRGSYQINVAMVKPEGMGELQKRIDELKARLMNEGIFDTARKRMIPFLPQRLGIATSPTGAAVRDIIKVALRRYPNIEIIIAPAIVQGEGAPLSIARAIEELNKPEYNTDVIIAGRGGGSFEDLMPFNEEIVIRAFYNSRVPIISAVGHQIDHPLSDDAADVAAPTPSAAAEMVVPVKSDVSGEIEYQMIRANNALVSMIRDIKTRINVLTARRIFRDPYEIVNSKEMILSDVEGRIISHLKNNVSTARNRLLLVSDIKMLINNIIHNKKHAYVMAVKAIEQLSPLSVLQRGYAIALNEEGTVLRNVHETAVDNLIQVLLHDGTLRCAVQSIQSGGCRGKEKSPEDES